MIGMSVFRMQAIPRQSAMPESFRRRTGRAVQKKGRLPSSDGSRSSAAQRGFDKPRISRCKSMPPVQGVRQDNHSISLEGGSPYGHPIPQKKAVKTIELCPIPRTNREQYEQWVSMWVSHGTPAWDTHRKRATSQSLSALFYCQEITAPCRRCRMALGLHHEVIIPLIHQPPHIVVAGSVSEAHSRLPQGPGSRVS